MIIGNRSTSKSKAISSYILSGINIKRMLYDQTNSDINISDLNIVRVSKRPIFKIKEREKQNNNLTASLPNKSFKIRSYTKKNKEGEKEESQIFQKVQKFRNGRANSNRIEIFNMPKENRVNKDQIEHKIESKLRQILQREASIKCKVSNQVFVKEVCQKSINSLCVSYQEFNSQRYREVAYKINAFFNPKFTSCSKVLLIVSVQALHVHSKRVFKGNQSSQQHANYKQGWINEQQVQVLKMFSSKYYSNWGQTKIAFKVNNAQQLTDLRHIMQVAQMDDYYCIFYPIKKYVQQYTLYQVDGLIQQISTLVVLQSKHKVQYQFPIVNSSINTLFVTTNNDNLVVLGRTASAIKCFIYETVKQLSRENDRQMIIEDLGQQNKEVEQDQRKQCTSKSIVVNAQFSVKQQAFILNTSELQAKLQLTLNSRALKASYTQSKQHNQSTCTQKQIKVKRRTLCERQNNNYPLTACKNRNINHQKWQVQASHEANLQKIKERLLLYMRSQSIVELVRETKNIRRFEVSDKADETEQISNYIRGECKSKTNHQIVSQLIKKNSAIYKQIDQYTHKIVNITSNNNNIMPSAFNSRQWREQSMQNKSSILIKAYKIV